MNLKSGLLLLLAFLIVKAEKTVAQDYPIQQPDIRNVVLTDNFWLPKIKTIQETTIQFAFDKCNEEGRMKNFLIAGGEMQGPVCGKMPFDDTDLYKIIEGASYSLISNPDPKLEAYLDSIIAIIKIGQEPDGYLTTWYTIDPKHPPASWVTPANQRWLNSGGHELYNSGHLFEAAAAHYRATGKRNFLEIALKNADLLVRTFGPGKLEKPPGHQIVETGLIKLYSITNNRKYLELAKFFLDQRGNAAGHKLMGPYSQDHKPVTQQEEAVGHAVRAVYMYAGMTDIAAIYNDAAYLNAVHKLWDNVVGKKMYLTGGIGSRHDGEAFGDNYELPNLTAYNETCAAIGDVYWNHRLFLLTGDSKYFDIIERTMYNGLISGISLDGKKFFYPNPLESDGKYEFNQGACTRKSWFDCSCCPTNLIRFIPSIPGLVYATDKNDLFVNLFVANHATLSVNGTTTEIIQQTNYPWNGKIKINVNPETAKEFTVRLRIPGWARNHPVPLDLYSYTDNNPGKIILKVNGKTVESPTEKGYLKLTRTWKNGDKIELDLPMKIHRVVTNEKVKDNRGLVAFERGPMVYCAEETDNNEDIDKIVIPDQTRFSVHNGPKVLEGVEELEGKVKTGNDTYTLQMVPYFSWSNRGIGKMKVWFPEKK